MTLGGSSNSGVHVGLEGEDMPTLKLTARSVESIKAKPTRVEYFDTEVPGLALRVFPSGVKSWSVFYRHRGRLRRLTLGTLSVISLAKARARARNELHAARQGADPATAKQDERKAETVAELADLYIAKWAKPKKRSWKADDNLLRKKVLPRWRQRAIVDITRQDVRALVEDVAEAGAPIVANRVVALISKLFAFALDRDLVTASPAVRIARPGRERQRDRVLTEDELRTLWVEFDALEIPMAAGAGARGKRQQSEAAATFTVDDFRGHDLRRTAASFMASGGVPRLTIKKILNHADRDITAVYDRHSYDPEKRAALEWWAAKLMSIIENRDSAKVLSFTKSA